MKLRPYQTKAVLDVEDAWTRVPNVLLRMATGTGKTPTFGEVLSRRAGGSVVIAHRAELVVQASTALAMYGIRHRIIGPAKLADRAAKTHRLHPLIGANHVDRNARTAVAGINTMVGMDPRDPLFQTTRTWVVDECFPAGTLVSGRPIESLCVGDTVEGFNEENGKLEPRKITRVFRNNEPKNMVRVTTARHHVLECTRGHPFYTRRGWVDAAALTLNDEVLTYELHSMRAFNRENDRGTTIPVSENRDGMLFNEMQHGVTGNRQAGDVRKTTVRTSRNAASGNKMFSVRPAGAQSFNRANMVLEKTRARVLFESLLKILHFPTIVRNNEFNESRVRIGPNERTQPHAFDGKPSESKRDTKTSWARAESAGREWPAANTCRNDIEHAIRLGRIRSAAVDTDKNATGFWVPDQLQAGPGALGPENCDRSGRSQPQRAAALGREKRRVLNWTRLDGVEIFQRSDTQRPGGSNPDRYVYNIEVEGLHTYVANGVVVHNCHHLQRDNVWGRGVAMFKHPDIQGLGVTATPGRPDGRGLGRSSDGLIDEMVVGAEMRWAINNGYLTGYKIFTPPSDIDYSEVPVTASGDLSPVRLSAAVHKSKKIVGDIVDHYLRLAAGKLGITFCVDVLAANEVCAEYLRRGVPAAVITGDTDPDVRTTVMNKFRKREYLQLVSVDILGEGVDIPAVEVVSMARRTESFIVYAQQFGRMVRLFLSPILAAAWDTYTPAQRMEFIAASEKPYGILIDHAGNFGRHGPPDAPRDWSLDRREKRGRGAAPTDVEPQRTCLNPNGMLGEGVPCQFTYARVLPACPECGHIPVPGSRGAPEHVDGDLAEVEADVLARLLGAVAAVDAEMPERCPSPVIPANMPPAGQAAFKARYFSQFEADRQAHYDRRDAQRPLRREMAVWGGWRAAEGDTVSMTQRRFYHTFGVDVLTAQTLNADEMEALTTRIRAALERANVIGGTTE